MSWGGGLPIDLNLGAAGWDGDTSGQRQPVCLGPREGRAGLPGPAPGPCLQPSREADGGGEGKMFGRPAMELVLRAHGAGGRGGRY